MLDIERIMEKIGQQLTIGDKRTDRIVLEAINDQLSDTRTNADVFCIYNKSGMRMFQYGTGSWCHMNRTLKKAESDYPDAGFYVGEIDG